LPVLKAGGPGPQSSIIQGGPVEPGTHPGANLHAPKRSYLQRGKVPWGHQLRGRRDRDKNHSDRSPKHHNVSQFVCGHTVPVAAGRADPNGRRTADAPVIQGALLVGGSEATQTAPSCMPPQ
jgi:hypothetical protein